MDSGFIKDIAISLALALALVIVVNVIGELLISPNTAPPARQPKPAAQQQTATPAATSAAPEIATPQGVASLLRAYDPQAGSRAFRKCKACHSSEKGGPNRVGPNLWDVVGREKGMAQGYKYSDAMKLKGGIWSYADLDRFLANPRTFVRGTKMSLKGFSDPALRASLIGYLRALSDSPKPLMQ